MEATKELHTKIEPDLHYLGKTYVLLCFLWLRSEADAGEDIGELAFAAQLREYRIDFEVH